MVFGGEKRVRAATREGREEEGRGQGTAVGGRPATAEGNVGAPVVLLASRRDPCAGGQGARPCFAGPARPGRRGGEGNVWVTHACTARPPFRHPVSLALAKQARAAAGACVCICHWPLPSPHVVSPHVANPVPLLHPPRHVPTSFLGGGSDSFPQEAGVRRARQLLRRPPPTSTTMSACAPVRLLRAPRRP